MVALPLIRALAHPYSMSSAPFFRHVPDTPTDSHLALPRSDPQPVSSPAISPSSKLRLSAKVRKRCAFPLDLTPPVDYLLESRKPDNLCLSSEEIPCSGASPFLSASFVVSRWTKLNYCSSKLILKASAAGYGVRNLRFRMR